MDYMENVRQGARFLDRVCPGWRRRIDRIFLDMQSFELCILGQLYGYYPDALYKLGLSEQEAYELGFHIGRYWTHDAHDPEYVAACAAEYVALRQAWITVLKFQESPMAS
jgi:hypothetical protein